MTHKLIYYGHDTLRGVAEKVETFDQELVDLTEEMFGIMQVSNGVGLAAPQIDIKRRIVNVDLSMNKGEKISIINPEIVWKSKDTVSYDEGCLSIPKIFHEVIRPSRIVVQGYTPYGKEIEIKAKNFFARVLQHEVDHLNGILFIDHLEDYIRKEYTRELKKIKKMNKK